MIISFQKGYCFLLNNSDYKVLQILSDAVRLMSEGELLQIEKARNLNLNEDIYYSIIREKLLLYFLLLAVQVLQQLLQKTDI